MIVSSFLEHLTRVASRIQGAYSAATVAGWASQRSRSASARAAIARFLSKAFVLRGPFTREDKGAATGGNSPKLIFIGWKLRTLPFPSALTWPPVVWLSKAPSAVVAGGGDALSPSRSEAAKRPAINPMAADST